MQGTTHERAYVFSKRPSRSPHELCGEGRGWDVAPSTWQWHFEARVVVGKRRLPPQELGVQMSFEGKELQASRTDDPRRLSPSLSSVFVDKVRSHLRFPPSDGEETPIGGASPSPRDRWSLFLVWAEAAWKVDVEERTLRRGGEDDMSAAAASAIEVDLERAVVAQVGKLGHAYNRWVYRPQHRVTLRFFEKDWMENLTRTPWWVIPAIWMPLVAWTGRQSLLVDDTHPQGLTAFFAIGMVAWGAMEYFIHRCLFHATPTSHWGITMHFLLHGCHHKSPDDRLRLVFPPAPAAIVIFLVHSILTVSLPTALAKAWFAGMLFGYVCYDCCHYFIHHGGKMEGILLGIRKNHMKHHYKDPAHGFGISTPLFDIVFGTLSQK